jgi:hypothetical protein
MKNEKTILFFDLEIEGRSKAKGSSGKSKPKNFDLRKCLDIIVSDLDNFIKNPKSKTIFVFSSTYFFEIIEVKTTKNHHIILTNIIQGNNANLFTRKIDTNELSTREKIDLTGKGLEYSSHIVINRAPNIKGKHLVRFEKTEHHSFKENIRYLNRLFQQVSYKNDSYSRDHFDGIAGKKMTVYPHLIFSGHPSETFEAELNDGIIKGITICFPSDELPQLDSGDHDSIKRVNVSLSTKSTSHAFGNFHYIKDNAGSVAKKLKADEIRISFEDETQQTRSVHVDSDMMLLKAEGFVKKHKIHHPNAVFDSAYTSIDDDIVNEILKLV